MQGQLQAPSVPARNGDGAALENQPLHANAEIGPFDRADGMGGTVADGPQDPGDVGLKNLLGHTRTACREPNPDRTDRQVDGTHAQPSAVLFIQRYGHVAGGYIIRQHFRHPLALLLDSFFVSRQMCGLRLKKA